MTKLSCPKCGNDSFKISVTERQEIFDTPQVTRKLEILTILNITCARCGWNTHYKKP